MQRDTTAVIQGPILFGWWLRFGYPSKTWGHPCSYTPPFRHGAAWITVFKFWIGSLQMYSWYHQNGLLKTSKRLLQSVWPITFFSAPCLRPPNSLVPSMCEHYKFGPIIWLYDVVLLSGRKIGTDQIFRVTLWEPVDVLCYLRTWICHQLLAQRKFEQESDDHHGYRAHARFEIIHF